MAFPGDPFAPRRRPTRVVRVGDVALGGDNPIRIQSMTTTDTQDVAATVAQTERLAAAGCEIVRITAPSVRDAEALGAIRAELFRRGVRVPLVADIHFTPNAAMVAAEHVEKVRINPGNFADKKKFEVREYDDAQWDDEARARRRALPAAGAALQGAGPGAAHRHQPRLALGPHHEPLRRHAARHGRVGARVPRRVRGRGLPRRRVLDEVEQPAGDDPGLPAAGASLSERARQGRPGDYPFHLGVTEAGDGEDGRIKSAIGIGSLLADGLGDTIRVSLTEDPVKEVPVARAIARRVESRWADAARNRLAVPDPGAPFVDDPYEHARRASARVASAAIDAEPEQVIAIGGDAPVRAELSIGAPPADPEAAAWRLADALGARREIACEGLRLDVCERSSARARAAVRRGARASRRCGAARAADVRGAGAPREAAGGALDRAGRGRCRRGDVGGAGASGGGGGRRARVVAGGCLGVLGSECGDRVGGCRGAGVGGVARDGASSRAGFGRGGTTGSRGAAGRGAPARARLGCADRAGASQRRRCQRRE